MELSEIDLNLLLLSQPIETTGRTSDRLRAIYGRSPALSRGHLNVGHAS
jgi:hypothetical protein